MKAKWYFSSLLIILTFLGVVLQPETQLPNQEMVFQFSQSEATITSIIQQLESLGADNIQVKNEDDVLRITYYSNADITSIKETLTEDVSVQVASSNTKNKPSKKRLNHQDFDIYEIQNANDNNTSTDGLIVEFKSEADRFTNPDIDVSLQHIQIKANKAFEEAYKMYGKIAIAIDHASYNNPEVRAGPIC